MKRILFQIAVALIFSATAMADRGQVDVNPLQTFREQMEQLRRDCARRHWDHACLQQKKIIKENMGKLYEICKEDPEDERCGAIMTERKEVRASFEVFCEQNPHETRCVKKREANKRREKVKRKFCAKNPDAKRCEPPPVREKSANSFLEYCKQNPERPMCAGYMEKQNRDKPQGPPDANTF